MPAPLGSVVVTPPGSVVAPPGTVVVGPGTVVVPGNVVVAPDGTGPTGLAEHVAVSGGYVTLPSADSAPNV